MKEKLVEIYKQNIGNAKTQKVSSGIMSGSKKPIMVSGLLSPDSEIEINPLWGAKFKLDEEGMIKVLEMLGDRIDKMSENDKEKIMSFIQEIYRTTEDYLGGHGNTQIRGKRYLEAEDGCLSLSDIQGEQIGVCAERTAMAQQMMAVLEKEGLLANYTTFITNSYITTDTREPHSFIILKHNTDSTKQYLFDIENLLKYKPTNESPEIFGEAFYPMTEQEFKDFQEGKSLCLKSIYEHFGMTVVDKPRLYGYEEVKQNQTNLNNGENR